MRLILQVGDGGGILEGGNVVELGRGGSRLRVVGCGEGGLELEEEGGGWKEIGGGKRRRGRGAGGIAGDEEGGGGRGWGEVGEGCDGIEYKDRAKERRDRWKASDKEEVVEGYRQSVAAINRRIAQESHQQHVPPSCPTAGAVHLRRRPPPPQPEPEWREKGAKLLKAMGWKEGGGLGKEGGGICEPVAAASASGRRGLGSTCAGGPILRGTTGVSRMAASSNMHGV